MKSKGVHNLSNGVIYRAYQTKDFIEPAVMSYFFTGQLVIVFKHIWKLLQTARLEATRP